VNISPPVFEVNRQTRKKVKIAPLIVDANPRKGYSNYGYTKGEGEIWIRLHYNFRGYFGL